MKALIVLALTLIPFQTSERLVSHNVQFRVNQDRTLTPVFPVLLTVEQEEGPANNPYDVLTCDSIQRTEPNRRTIVFKCGEQKFHVTGFTFQPSK